MWPTPTKSLYCTKIVLVLVNNCFLMKDDAAAAGSQFGIGKAARVWTHLWMLMQACGATPTKPFSFPSSHPLHLSLNAEPRSSPGDLTFNPNFSDWIMGWPIGRTDPMRPVTEWSAWLRRMRGELSQMPTLKGFKQRLKTLQNSGEPSFALCLPANIANLVLRFDYKKRLGGGAMPPTRCQPSNGSVLIKDHRRSRVGGAKRDPLSGTL